MVIENTMNDKKTFIHPYCLNLDTLGNCLGSLVSSRVLKKSRRESKYMHEIDSQQIEDYCNRLGKF